MQSSNGEISFLSSFVQFNSYCLQGPCSIDACRVLGFLWVSSERSRLLFLFFFRLKSSNCFQVKTHVFGKSFTFYFPSENFFEKKIFNSVVGVFLFIFHRKKTFKKGKKNQFNSRRFFVLILKMPMTRRDQVCRAVSTLTNTNVWG